MSERVLVTGARAPAAMDIARSLKAAGFAVHMADCASARIARWSRAPTAVHRYGSPVMQADRFARDIRRLLERLDPVAVIPTCEEVFHLVALAQADGWSDRLIAPSPHRLMQLHHKGQFAALCQTLDLQVPETATATDAASLMAQVESGDVVIKAAWSRFGARTFISPTASRLVEVRPSLDQPWIVQRRLHGDEVSFYAVAHEGRLTAFSAYRSDWRASGGAAYVFSPVERRLADRLGDMAQTLAGFVETGQFACDAIIDADGSPWLIECNPRATSGVHLFGRSAALGQALLGRDVAEPDTDNWRNGAMFDTFGLVAGLRTGRMGGWRKDRRGSRDILPAPADALPRFGALVDAAGFGLRALTSRRSLAEAMTADIEWNGQPLTPALWKAA